MKKRHNFFKSMPNKCFKCDSPPILSICRRYKNWLDEIDTSTATQIINENLMKFEKEIAMLGRAKFPNNHEVSETPEINEPTQKPENEKAVEMSNIDERSSQVDADEVLEEESLSSTAEERREGYHAGPSEKGGERSCEIDEEGPPATAEELEIVIIGEKTPASAEEEEPEIVIIGEKPCEVSSTTDRADGERAPSDNDKDEPFGTDKTRNRRKSIVYDGECEQYRCTFVFKLIKLKESESEIS